MKQAWNRKNQSPLWIAHIEPAEEGGQWRIIRKRGSKLVKAENLLPLCEGKYTSVWEAQEKSGRIDDVGCHKLYDNEAVWSRSEMRWLLSLGPRRRVPIARPPNGKRLDPPDSRKQELHELEDVAEGKISFRKGRQIQPFKTIQQRLKDSSLSDDGKGKYLRLGLRLARRAKGALVNEKRSKLIRVFTEGLKNLEAKAPNDTREIYQYERAMVYFEYWDFRKALALLSEASTSHPHREVGGWWINEAQALVTEFEIERGKGRVLTSAKKIKIHDLIRQLQEALPNLEKLARRRGSKGPRKTWPVTARLHIARMKAYLGDPSGWKVLKKAEQIRDRQINVDVWERCLANGPERLQELQQISGWSRYSQVLLLHAKGECFRARAASSSSKKDYVRATEFLALAARRIIQDQYKNFEYLDNVLEGLERIPCDLPIILDDSRERLAEARKLLVSLRKSQAATDLS